MRKFSNFLLIFVILLLAGCALEEDYNSQGVTGYISVSWAQGYADINELTEGSDLIALVEVKDIASAAVKQGLPHTVFIAEVLNPVYNTRRGECISIYMTGGKIDGKTVEVTDDPLLKPGEQFLVFCRKNADGTHTILGGPQGRFVHENGKLSSMDVANERVKKSTAVVQVKLDKIDASEVYSKIQVYLSEMDKNISGK